MGWVNRLFAGTKQSNVFVLLGESSSPYEYGQKIVGFAFDTSESSVNQLIQLGSAEQSDASIYFRVRQQPNMAQMLMVALGTSVYVVAALLRPGVSKDVMSEVVRGVNDRLENSSFGSETKAWVNAAAVSFSRSLAKEIQSPSEDIGDNMGSGPTAQLACSLLISSYRELNSFKHLQPLALSAFEEFGLTTMIQAILKGGFDAIDQMDFRYTP